MAQVGYTFECCWCGTEVCFVEERFESENVVTAELAPTSTVTSASASTSDSTAESGHSSVQTTQTIETASVSRQAAVCALQLRHQPRLEVDGPSYSRVPSSLDDLRPRD